jgi:superfamily II DNA or RNA helicase
MDLPYYNTTNFPLSVKNQLSALKNPDDKLKYQQFLVKEFFTKTKQRGLLICHSMGQGKTRIAVAVALHFRAEDPKRKVIILSAKSLADNFKKELRDYTKSDDKSVGNVDTKVDTITSQSASIYDEEYIDKNFMFVSLNSGNMFQQILNINKSKEEIAVEKKLGDIEHEESSLENSLIIVDEAHNLFNAVTNNSKNAIGLYDLIMKTKNIRILFMSGTPVINDPFELVPCFNMLRGPLIVDSGEPTVQKNSKSKLKTKSKNFTTLFPEDYEEFEFYFIDTIKKKIKNKDKFTNRIYGLCSYYGDLYFNTDGDKPGFPKELPNIVEKIPMSETQFAKYNAARILELEETKKKFRGAVERFSASKGGSSTYRVKTRQISNYCIPEYALGPVRGAKAREKFIDKITTDDLRDLAKFSPKMAKMLSNVKKYDKQLGMVYSQFVSGEGIAIFARVLEANGWMPYGAHELSSREDYDLKKESKVKTFAILSGDITPETRSDIIAKFNSNDGVIQLLLLSGAVAEGIDLKRIRHVHIMEPFWNYARINQVKTRAIRYKSHTDLPPDQQNVQVYIYLSDYPLSYPDKKKTEDTTDVDLYKNSMDNMKLIDTFMVALAEASIDCSVHHSKLDKKVQEKINCKICSPDNVQLYHPSFKKDMDLPSSCKLYKESKVNVNEIALRDKKYFYKKEGDIIKIYHYSDKLKGYTVLPRTNPDYGEIISMVIDSKE